MTWQQSFVVLWIQFALGAAVILLLTRLGLRWVSQPVERTRLILGMLCAVLTLPVLSTVVPLPTWNLGLISIDSGKAHAVVTQVASDQTLIADVEDPINDRDSNKQASMPVNGSAQQPSPISIHGNVSPQQLNDSKDPVGRNSTRAAFPGISRINVWAGWAFAIILVHAVAAIYFVIELAVGQLRIVRLCSNASPISESARINWNAITANRGRPVRLLVSDELHVPLMFGWLRPTIVVPSRLAEQGGSELDACLAHEWSHIERFDMLAWYFLNFCQFVLWYQPGFWNLRRELRINQEILADARSSHRMTRVDYADFLLQTAKSRGPALALNALTLFDEPSQLTRRITMLLQNQIALIERCRWRFTSGILIGAIVLAVTTSSLRLGSVQANDPEVPAPQSPQPSTTLDPDSLVDAAKPNEPAPAIAAAKADDREKDAQPKFRSVTYQQTIVTKGTQIPAITREFLSQDGRKRSELSGGVVTISDEAGYPRITLFATRKTATIHPERAATKFKRPASQNGFEQRKLAELKKSCESATEKLGQRKIDGKQSNGFVVKFLGMPHSVWLDAESGEIVQVEYDTSPQAQSSSFGTGMHITCSDFQFDKKLDESLFSFEVPAGYKVSKQLAVASTFSSEEQKRLEAISGMQRAWSQNNGSWLVATNPVNRTISACNLLGILMTFDDHGRIQSSFAAGMTKVLRVTDLDGDGKYEFVTASGLGGSTVQAWRSDGELLWTYSRENEPGHDWSINDICAIDLNDDGKQELVVGFNGSTGLHIVNSDGKLVRKDTTVGNVWHVTAGRLDPERAPEVVCTAADGKVHRFDNQGQALPVMNVGNYANLVRLWEPTANDTHAARIIVGGTKPERDPKNTDLNADQVLGAVDSQGNRLWSLDLPSRIVSATTCPTKPWVAVTLGDGTLRIIEVIEGKQIARISGQAEMTDVAWLTTKEGDPWLILGNRIALNAFKVDAEQR